MAISGTKLPPQTLEVWGTKGGITPSVACRHCLLQHCLQHPLPVHIGMVDGVGGFGREGGRGEGGGIQGGGFRSGILFGGQFEGSQEPLCPRSPTPFLVLLSVVSTGFMLFSPGIGKVPPPPLV